MKIVAMTRIPMPELCRSTVFERIGRAGRPLVGDLSRSATTKVVLRSTGHVRVTRMFARRIAVVGTGYVGLTTGACLASLGHRVVCADVDEDKVERLRAGEIGIREDGLAELVSEGMAAGRLSFVVGAGTARSEERR